MLIFPTAASTPVASWSSSAIYRGSSQPILSMWFIFTQKTKTCSTPLCCSQQGFKCLSTRVNASLVTTYLELSACSQITSTSTVNTNRGQALNTLMAAQQTPCWVVLNERQRCWFACVVFNQQFSVCTPFMHYGWGTSWTTSSSFVLPDAPVTSQEKPTVLWLCWLAETQSRWGAVDYTQSFCTLLYYAHVTTSMEKKQICTISKLTLLVCILVFFCNCLIYWLILCKGYVSSSMCDSDR